LDRLDREMPKFETHKEMLTHWTAEAQKMMPKGSTVLGVRYDSDNAMIITLLAPDSQTIIGLVPLSDDEGNGPGAVHVQTHIPNKNPNEDSETKTEILPQMGYEFNVEEIS